MLDKRLREHCQRRSQKLDATNVCLESLTPETADPDGDRWIESLEASVAERVPASCRPFSRENCRGYVTKWDFTLSGCRR